MGTTGAMELYLFDNEINQSKASYWTIYLFVCLLHNDNQKVLAFNRRQLGPMILTANVSSFIILL